MTLEEAKKEIKKRSAEMWDDYKKNGNMIAQGFSHGLDEALETLDKVESSGNLDNVIRNLESEEAVCRSHSEDDYYRGLTDGYKLSIDALKGLSGNPEQLTLRELARELRKLFEFDYVTVDAEGSITFWVRKPLYISMCGLWDRNAYLDSWDIFDIHISSVAVNLDLSEYADENGNIDYSKCIVEVE